VSFSDSFSSVTHSTLFIVVDPSGIPTGASSLYTVYDLVANVTHSSAAGTARENTVWKAHVHTRSPSGNVEEERWFEIMDLVIQEINRQMVFLGESYIQVGCHHLLHTSRLRSC
jgi:hypothetical protein